ncbi:MAG TPA: hypothetical protein VEX62_06150, partial [Candidatus Limnocylindrales bacterium]|nr:hypothetical protein [Candidatus Limnocylindrales bacterium]
MPTAPVAYFWGEDAWSIENASRTFATALAADAGTPLDVWRTSGDEDDSGDGAAASASRRRGRVLDQVAERLSTATLFGGGTLVVVRQPGSLVREAAARERLISLVANVAPGNALCFVD